MSSTPQRNVGIDLARFLAVFGMVYFDMVIFASDRSWSDPQFEWLMLPVDCADGRASALFVILAGVGLTLITGHFHGATPKEGEALRTTRKVVIKRALFLMFVGYLWQASGWWYVSILHFYGFFLTVGLLCVGMSARALWGLIVLFIAGAAAMNGIFEYGSWESGAEWPAPASLFYRAEFYNPVLHARDFFFNGTYPVIPWFAYTLFGIWLGQSPMTDPRFRKRVLVSASVVLAVAVGAGLALKNVTFESDWFGDLASLDRSPPGPLYVISATAQGAVGYCLCLMLGERFPKGKVTDALVATGQMSFTIYIIRIFIGGGFKPGLFDYLELLDTRGALDGWFRTAIFMGATIPICYLWKRRIGRGPLEALMRKVSG